MANQFQHHLDKAFQHIKEGNISTPNLDRLMESIKVDPIYQSLFDSEEIEDYEEITDAEWLEAIFNASPDSPHYQNLQKRLQNNDGEFLL